MTKIAVIGTGYVGLTTGACFAHMGHQVVCADIDPVKVESLRKGVIPIVELGLQELVEEGIAGGRLSFVLGAASAVEDCEIAFLCVPTPQGEDGSADLSYIEAAARRDRPGSAVRGSRRQQVDRAGRQRQGRRASHGPPRREGRLQPRVPPRGLGGAGLPASPTASSSAATTRPRH